MNEKYLVKRVFMIAIKNVLKARIFDNGFNQFNCNTVGYDKEQYFIIHIAHSFTAFIGSLAGSLTCS